MARSIPKKARLNLAFLGFSVVALAGVAMFLSKDSLVGFFSEAALGWRQSVTGKLVKAGSSDFAPCLNYKERAQKDGVSAEYGLGQQSNLVDGNRQKLIYPTPETS